jgi:hypothetical protein
MLNNQMVYTHDIGIGFQVMGGTTINHHKPFIPCNLTMADMTMHPNLDHLGSSNNKPAIWIGIDAL